MTGDMMELVMFRKDIFYLIEVPADVLKTKTQLEVAKDNADCNPGTIRVEDVTGKVLWTPTPIIREEK